MPLAYYERACLAQLIMRVSIDIDSLLTKDGRKAVESARKELKEGKTISLDALKKEL